MHFAREGFSTRMYRQQVFNLHYQQESQSLSKAIGFFYWHFKQLEPTFIPKITSMLNHNYFIFNKLKQGRYV
jgi:hypothetical protein